MLTNVDRSGRIFIFFSEVLSCHPVSLDSTRRWGGPIRTDQDRPKGENTNGAKPMRPARTGGARRRWAGAVLALATAAAVTGLGTGPASADIPKNDTANGIKNDAADGRAHGTAHGTANAPGAKAPAAAPDPASDARLERFIKKAPKWRQRGLFRCATLTVPVDYADPGNGRTFTLPLIKAPASKPDQRIGTLVAAAGGPGQSGTWMVRTFHESWPAPLRERFDVVAFDPRGVGGSKPAIDCGLRGRQARRETTRRPAAGRRGHTVLPAHRPGLRPRPPDGLPGHQREGRPRRHRQGDRAGEDQAAARGRPRPCSVFLASAKRLYVVDQQGGDAGRRF